MVVETVVVAVVVVADGGGKSGCITIELSRDGVTGTETGAGADETGAVSINGVGACVTTLVVRAGARPSMMTGLMSSEAESGMEVTEDGGVTGQV